MSMTPYLVWFVDMAIAINGLIYGGVTWVYFVDKQRVAPSKPPEDRWAPESSDRSMSSEDHGHHHVAA